MVVNPKRIQVLLLGPKNKITQNDFVIKIDDQVLQKSEDCLGITISIKIFHLKIPSPIYVNQQTIN